MTNPTSPHLLALALSQRPRSSPFSFLSRGSKHLNLCAEHTWARPAPQARIWAFWCHTPSQHHEKHSCPDIVIAVTEMEISSPCCIWSTPGSQPHQEPLIPAPGGAQGRVWGTLCPQTQPQTNSTACEPMNKHIRYAERSFNRPGKNTHVAQRGLSKKNTKENKEKKSNATKKAPRTIGAFQVSRDSYPLEASKFLPALPLF